MMGKTAAIAKFQDLIEKVIFVCPVKILRVIYQIVLIFAEETESPKKPNFSRGSSGVIFIFY